MGICSGRRVSGLLELGVLIATAFFGFANNVLAQVLAKPIEAELLQLEPYKYTGLFITDLGGGYINTCSGAVVKSTRIVLTAAHCVFDEEHPESANAWNTRVCWNLTHAGGNPPSCTSSKYLRAYFYFTSYTSLVKNLKNTHAESFNADFIAAYHYTDLASVASGYWHDGNPILAGSYYKLIVGYPSGLYQDGEADKYRMHQTGPFNHKMEQGYQNYYVVSEVSAGKGNSGGPVFGWDPITKKYYYAGDYVSGLSRKLGETADLIGVRAMNADTFNLVDQAIDAAKLAIPPEPPKPLSEKPAMIISSNGSEISRGDSHPSKDDQTNFGTTRTKATITKSYLIKNSGSGNLILDEVDSLYLSGSRSSKAFRIIKYPALTIASNRSSSFKIRFSSNKRGTFKAWVNVISNDPRGKKFKFLIQAVRQ